MPDAGWAKDCHTSLERSRIALKGIQEPAKKVVKAESRKKVDLIPWETRWSVVPWDIDPPAGYKALHEKDPLINLVALCNQERMATFHCQNGVLGCTH